MNSSGSYQSFIACTTETKNIYAPGVIYAPDKLSMLFISPFVSSKTEIPYAHAFFYQCANRTLLEDNRTTSSKKVKYLGVIVKLILRCRHVQIHLSVSPKISEWSLLHFSGGDISIRNLRVSLSSCFDPASDVGNCVP